MSPTYSRPKTGSVEILAAHREGPTSRSPRRFNRVTSGAFRPQYRVDALTTPASDTPRATASSWTRCTTVCGTNGPPCSEPSTSTRSPGPASRTVRPTSPHSAHSRSASTGRGSSGRRSGSAPQSSVSVTRASRAISSGATARTSSCGRSTATVSPPANRTRAARKAATWNDRPSATVHEPPSTAQTIPGSIGCDRRELERVGVPGHDQRLVQAELTLEHVDVGARPLEQVHHERGRLVEPVPLDEVEAQDTSLPAACLCVRHASKGTAVLGRSDGAWPRGRTRDLAAL